MSTRVELLPDGPCGRLALVCAVLIGSQALAAPSGYREFKDWVAGCDQTAHCTAIGLAPSDGEGYAMLHFERGPAPSDQVNRITLRVDGAVPGGATGWSLQADGKALLALNASHWVEADSGEGQDVALTAAADVQRVLGVLRSAARLALHGPDGVAGEVSLAGASAALLWIDERQQRLDTPGAFVRTGTREATAPRGGPAAVPPDPTVWQPADAALLGGEARRALEPDSCDAIEDLVRTPNDLAWTGPEGAQLVQVDCYAGAYNFSSRWFHRARVDAPLRLLSFTPPATFEATDAGPWTDLVNADFDPASGRLYTYSKGRGIGDCGSAAQWAYADGDFRLLSFRMMGDCRGVWIDYWPVLWREAETAAAP